MYLQYLCLFLLTCTAHAQTIPEPPVVPIVATSSIVLADYSTSSIKAYIEALAPLNGVSVDLALYIALHESGFDYKNVGDENIYCKLKSSPFYGKAVYARGVYQFTRCYYPTVTDKQAFDPVYNINRAMPLLKEETTCRQQFTTCEQYYTTKH